jgi:hypothetical protein
MLQFTDASGGISQKELTMTKSILVSLGILTPSTSAALAAHRTHHRHAIHSPAMNAGMEAPLKFSMS